MIILIESGVHSFQPIQNLWAVSKSLWPNNASGEKCLTSSMAIESCLGTQGFSGGDSKATWSAQCPVLRTVEREDVQRCDATKWLYMAKHIGDAVQQLEWWQTNSVCFNKGSWSESSGGSQSMSIIANPESEQWIFFVPHPNAVLLNCSELLMSLPFSLTCNPKTPAECPGVDWLWCFEPWAVQRWNHARPRVYMCLDNLVWYGGCWRSWISSRECTKLVFRSIGADNWMKLCFASVYLASQVLKVLTVDLIVCDFDAFYTAPWFTDHGDSQWRFASQSRSASCNAQIFNTKTLKSCVRHLAQMQKHHAKPADTDTNSTVYSDLKRDVDSCGKEVEDHPQKVHVVFWRSGCLSLAWKRFPLSLMLSVFALKRSINVISSNDPQLFAQKQVPTADVLSGGLLSTASCRVRRRFPQLDVCFDGKAMWNRSGWKDADGKWGSPTNSWQIWKSDDMG